MVLMIYLKCRKCGEEKEESLFVFCNGIRQGLCCRVCRNAQIVLARNNKELIQAKKNELLGLKILGVFICSKCNLLKQDSLFPQAKGIRHGTLCCDCVAKNKSHWHSVSEKGKAQAERELIRINKAIEKKNIKDDRKYRHSIATKTNEYCVCSKCNKSKNGTDFPVNKQGKRHGKKCLECSVVTTREYFYKQMELNPKRMRAIGAHRTNKRRAGKALRTPKWANSDKILDIYMNRPDGYHVDHIIPLFGKYVSGLHVETNLQYLTATDNFKKSNKF